MQSKTQDFRDSKWSGTPIESKPGGFTTHIAAPDSGYGAAYADIVYDDNGKQFHITTQLQILHK